ncbi:group II intron maturase-specific domain-containing protein [Amycolatopsis pigmentata]|uniref:Group II intron maturase-specific domain-containing protein n=1 Tax=Amycolatopsis pigmentata TaxID=450801 RepID=A0ABW5FM51_9PSEU
MTVADVEEQVGVPGFLDDLRLSPEKTRVRHLSDGVDFLGFHIQWRRKRGSGRWFVYTFIGDRPILSLKTKIRALTHRGSQQNPEYVITRLNQILRGWSNYFKHAVAKHRFSVLERFVWRRVTTMLQTRHHWGWKDIRRRLTTPTGRWRPISTANGTELFDLSSVTVSRYRWRGNRIPNRWTTLQPA